MVGRGSIKVAIGEEDEVLHGRTRGADSTVGPLGAEVAGRTLTSDSLILGGPFRDTLDPAEIDRVMRDPGAPRKGSQESIFLILPEAQDHGQLIQVYNLLKLQVLTFRKTQASASNRAVSTKCNASNRSPIGRYSPALEGGYKLDSRLNSVVNIVMAWMRRPFVGAVMLYVLKAGSSCSCQTIMPHFFPRASILVVRWSLYRSLH